MDRILDLSIVIVGVGIPLLIVFGIVVQDIAAPLIERRRLKASNKEGRLRVHLLW